MSYDPKRASELQTSVAWSVLTRIGLDAKALGTWDKDLLREPRILVPIDVQGLVVDAQDEAEAAVRLLSPLSPGASPELGVLEGPVPFADGRPREPGVHLHWALPDSLLRGELRDPDPPREEPRPQAGGPTAEGGGLGLPALPDKWVVLRLLAAEEGTAVAVRGWVLDAADAVAWELGSYPDGAPLGDDEEPAPPVPREGLTGAAGGELTWTGGYDAAYGRFAWHDPLDDLAADRTLGGTLSGGPAGGRATYVVAGWWSDAELDPLDPVRTERGLAERLASLGWRLPPGGGTESQEREGALGRASSAGLDVARRWAGVGVTKARAAKQAVAQAVSGLAAEAKSVADARPVGGEASTLLHGALVGVPVLGGGGPDLRPGRDAARLAIGDSLEELVATLAASSRDLDGEERTSFERLLAAFQAGLLARLGSVDGLADVDEARHAALFASVDPEEPPELDRVRTGRAKIPPRTRRVSGAPPRPGKVTLGFFERKVRGFLVAESSLQTIAQPVRSAAPPPPRPPAPAEPGEEVVERPAPPRYVFADPVLAVRGAGRNLRHGGDGRWSQDGRLGVRRPSQVAQDYEGIVRGADLLPSLGSGALPDEVLPLTREALQLSPHLTRWRARAAAASGPQRAEGPVLARLTAELALRFDATGAYTAASGLGASADPRPAAAVPGSELAYARVVAERLRRHSQLAGVEPDPVGITAWAQPWVPLWLEYEVALELAAPPGELGGWQLGSVDHEPAEGQAPETPDGLEVSGRVPLTTGPAAAAAAALAEYVKEEDERDRTGKGEVDADVRNALFRLGSTAGSLDLLGATLDGVRPALLGLPPAAAHLPEAARTPVDLPRLLAAGTLALTRARVVDAFGRTLELDPAGTVVPARLEVPDRPGTRRLPPRFSAPARCRLRLVGAAAEHPRGAVPARVDEIDPGAQVNPVAGFLLPDHVDESIEVFSVAGTPLGELLVEPVGGGVTWEPAPGRPLPHDAPPSAGLGPEEQALGRLAAGLVAADAAARDGRPADEAAPAESALSAFLRAIDTTLWTVDTVAGVGSSAVGGIVGRPVAVVAATLLLDLRDDLGELDLDEEGLAARAAAYRDAAHLELPVRLGELTRTDDGLLGYYVDGDFTTVHLVDRVVAELARESGRGRGHLGTWGETPTVPEQRPIEHPYLSMEQGLVLRPGVPRLLMLLMLPGAAVHVTSGVVPREKLRLARAWFADGLDRLSPSVRVGPVLVDPGQVRLPLVAALGEKQTLTTREGPLGWRDDAILAATQSAVLPDRSAVLREGWIRVTPETTQDEPPGRA
jgi:hypothetical protein